MITITILLITNASMYPYTTGLSFLEKVPGKFECMQMSAAKSMTKDASEHTQRWRRCEKEEIC